MDLRHLNEKALLVLGIIVVAAALLFGPVSGPLVDSALYADIAQNLLLHGSFNSNFTPSTQNPFLPIVLAVFMALFGGLWMKAFIVFNGLALLAAIWLFAREAVGEKAALPAALVFLAAPVVVYAGLDLLTDALFLTLSLFGAWAYLRLLKGYNKTDAALFVAFNALAILTRNTGFLLMVIYSAHFAWTWFSAKDKAKAKALFMKIAFLVLVFGLLGAAWNARNLVSGLNDSSEHYAGLLAKQFNAEIFLQNQGGKTAAMLSETRIDADGQRTILNTPLRFTLPFNAGNTAMAVPIQLAYLLRLIAYLFIFVGPILVLTVAWKAFEAYRKGKKEAKAEGKEKTPTTAGKKENKAPMEKNENESRAGSKKPYNPADTGRAFSFLIVWFAVFAGFHVLWPAAFSMRYVAPLVMPLAVCFGKAVGNGKRLFLALLVAQLLISVAVVSWDMNARWAPSKAAADGFEKMGNWLKANTPQGSTITAAGVPVNAISFYGKRKAVLEGGEYTAWSNYLSDKAKMPQGQATCFEYQDDKNTWQFKIFSRSGCP